MSANDYPDRNPRTWSLWGMKEGSQSFKVIHFVEAETFTSFWEQKDYDLAPDKAATKYVAVQLQIKDVQKKGGGIQIGQFFLSQSVKSQDHEQEKGRSVPGKVGSISPNPVLGLNASLSNLSISVDQTQHPDVLDVPVEQSPNNPGRSTLLNFFCVIYLR